MSAAAPEGVELGAGELMSLGLSRTFYALARALRIDRLRSLLSGAALDLEAPVWLLGERYGCAPGAGEAEQEEASGSGAAAGR